MNKSKPNYINKNIGEYPIDYTWDDNIEMEEYFDFTEAKYFSDRLSFTTIRAKRLVIIGLYDWVLARLAKQEFDPVFIHMAEAVKCANIDQFYIEYLELSRNDYVGAVSGVLWCSCYSCLLNEYYMTENPKVYDDPENQIYDTYLDFLLDDSLSFMIALTFHIMPSEEKANLKQWLEVVIDRLVKYYTIKEEDPFDNLFGAEEDPDWLGDHISLELLDPAIDYDPKKAVALNDAYLQSVDYKNNPLLRTPKDVKHWVKKSYRLTPAK